MQRADSLGKNPASGKDWGQEKGTTEDERLDGITDSMDMSLSKFWEIVKEGSLVCYSLWDHKELDTTEQLNKNKCTLVEYVMQ